MKIALAMILSMVITAVVAPKKPEVVHFGDKVRVTRGFYAGCTGVATMEISEGRDYMIDLTCQGKFVGGKLLEKKDFVLDRYYIMEEK